MREYLRNARNAMPYGVALSGIALISAGASLVYLPAGLIAAGVLLIAAAIDSRL